MKAVQIPVALGELIDKITILEIKAERISSPDALQNIRRELEALLICQREAVANTGSLETLVSGLRAVNRRIWDLEENIRSCERAQDFGATFVAHARQIYAANDERAGLKRQINVMLGSELVEEKSYKTNGP